MNAMMSTAQPGPLATLAAVPEVAVAVEQARDACAELRWHQAMRRRGDQARTEAGVWAAQASAELDGARLPLTVVRDIARGHARAPGDAVGEAVMGALRAQAEGVSLAVDGAKAWRTGARGSLARLHTAAAAGLLASEEVGRPVAGAGARVSALVDLLHSAGADPAPVLAAVVQAEIAVAELFRGAPGVMSRAASRSLVVGLGLDPVGVVVAERGWARDPQRLQSGLEAYRSGSVDGVAAWVVEWCAMVVEGARFGREVCDTVVAGVPAA